MSVAATTALQSLPEKSSPLAPSIESVMVRRVHARKFGSSEARAVIDSSLYYCHVPQGSATLKAAKTPCRSQEDGFRSPRYDKSTSQTERCSQPEIPWCARGV
jgi:hypothetical protein